MVADKHLLTLAVLVMLNLATAAWAQDAPALTKPVYRCPGPPVLYTDNLTTQEAQDRGCRTIEGAAVTIVQPNRPRPAASTAPSSSSAANTNGGGARTGENRIDPAAQRARDTDARRILTDELQREEARLAALQKEFNNGEPERRGDERNYAKYQERVAEMKASIARKEADVAALKRELGKLPQ